MSLQSFMYRMFNKGDRTNPAGDPDGRQPLLGEKTLFSLTTSVKKTPILINPALRLKSDIVLAKTFGWIV